MKPFKNHIIVEVPSEEEETASGIILVQQAKERPTKGTVVSVNGVDVKRGDTVYFRAYAGDYIDDNRIVLHESALLAVEV